jgi:uracil-DNA glycosylase family 4
MPSLKTKHSKLEALKAAMRGADLPLKKTAANIVFGDGRCDAPIVFVGEAPGKNEDLQGLPFVGAAGKILNEMLHTISLDRKDAFITSILKYRPPNNRVPRLEEIVAHTPYLIDQIRIIEPKVIVPLGNFASRFILSGFTIEKMGTVPNISALHGKMNKVSFEGKTFAVVALYHPAAVLYNRSLYETLKKDFRSIGRLLKKHSS